MASFTKPMHPEEHQQFTLTHPRTGEPVTFENSSVNGGFHGKRSREFWNCLDFERCWIDPGPSPAGNEGHYLKVPMHVERADAAGFCNDTIHRIYPKWGGVKKGGVPIMVAELPPEAGTGAATARAEGEKYNRYTAPLEGVTITEQDWDDLQKAEEDNRKSRNRARAILAVFEPCMGLVQKARRLMNMERYAEADATLTEVMQIMLEADR